MTLAEFSNALRILHSMDFDEVASFIGDTTQWHDFRRDPVRFFLRADDALQDKLWAIVERRQKRRETVHG